MPTEIAQPGQAFAGASDGFRRTLEAVELGLWQWNLATNAIELSPCACGLLDRRSARSLDYDGFIALLHPDDRPTTQKTLQDSATAGGRFDFDFRVATTERWLRARGHIADGVATAILLDAGEPAFVEEMNSRLAAIVTSSDDAILGVALDGNLTDWNRGAEAVFGYTAAEVIGKPLTILIPHGQERESQEILDRLKRGERIEHYETRRRRKDGAIIDVSLTVSPVFDRVGHLVGASKVSRDITTAKRAQVALQERGYCSRPSKNLLDVVERNRFTKGREPRNPRRFLPR